MNIEIRCTHISEIVSDDIWPWHKVGDRIMCPRQIPGTSKFCANCQFGYPSIIVREVDEKHILLDPREVPEWIKNEWRNRILRF